MPRIPTKAHCTHGWPWFSCPHCDYLNRLVQRIVDCPTEYLRILEHNATLAAIRANYERLMGDLWR